jgi:hypothetical protein
MSTNGKRVLGLTLGAIVLWQLGGLLFPERTGPDRLVNQLWIERMPTGQRDLVWHFAAIEHEGRRFGALAHASAWRVHADRFLWKQQGDQFEFTTPQNGCHSSLKVRTWKCAGQAPKPFELCLEFVGMGKTYRYFSREDWEIRPGARLEGEVAFASAALQAAQPLEEAAGDADPAAPSCEGFGPAAN